MKSAVGLFNTLEQAQSAVEALHSAGVASDNISVVAHNGHGHEVTGQATTTGATGGAVLGGALGILAGLAALAIPGIGPALVAGPIVGGLVGAGAGALSGSLAGSLVDAGIAEEDAVVYWEGVRRGGALVVVNTHGDQQRADSAATVLAQQGAVDVKERGNHWRTQGWEGYHPAAEPYTSDEIRAHRLDAMTEPLINEIEAGAMAGQFDEYMSLNVTGGQRKIEDANPDNDDATLPVDADSEGLPPTDAEHRKTW